MIVTLRKAHALSKALLEAAKKLPLERVVTISIYDETAIEDRVEAAGEVLTGHAQVARSLIAASFRIRAAIGSANQSAGVDRLLTEKAALDATEKLLSKLTESDYTVDQATDPVIAPQKLEAIKARNGAAERYGSVTEELVVKVATAELLAPITAELQAIRKRKTAIADDLLALNTATTISLDAETVGLLKTTNLI